MNFAESNVSFLFYESNKKFKDYMAEFCHSTCWSLDAIKLLTECCPYLLSYFQNLMLNLV